MKPQKPRVPHVRDAERVKRWALAVQRARTKRRITCDDIGAEIGRTGATVATILRLATMEGRGVSHQMMRRVGYAVRNIIQRQVEDTIRDFNQYSSELLKQLKPPPQP